MVYMMKIVDIKAYLVQFACGMDQIKTLDVESGPGANHGDSRRYRADWQRRHDAKDTF